MTYCFYSLLNSLSVPGDANHTHGGWMPNVRFMFILCFIVHTLVMNVQTGWVVCGCKYSGAVILILQSQSAWRTGKSYSCLTQLSFSTVLPITFYQCPMRSGFRWTWLWSVHIFFLRVLHTIYTKISHTIKTTGMNNTD